MGGQAEGQGASACELSVCDNKLTDATPVQCVFNPAWTRTLYL